MLGRRWIGRQTQISEIFLHYALYIALCHKMLFKHSEDFPLYSLIVVFPITYKVQWDDFWIK